MKVVDGYIETDDGLEKFEIVSDVNNPLELNVYCNDELRDDITIIEFLEEVGGYYYPTKKDYKKDEIYDLSLIVLKHILQNA